MNPRRLIKNAVSEAVFPVRRLVKAGLLKRKACRILMYHAVEEKERAIDKMGLAVPPRLFLKHMEYLKENGFNVVGLGEIVSKIKDRMPIPKKSIVITFDDGFRSVLYEALPILKKFAFPATLFVNIDYIEKRISCDFYCHKWEALDSREVAALHNEGMSIGSHALTHTPFTQLDDERLHGELAASKKAIEKIVNSKIDALSYPSGAFDKRAAEAVRNAGFSSACTSVGGLTVKSANLFALKRTEITAFDDSKRGFEKKLLGCYDWVGLLKRNG